MSDDEIIRSWLRAHNSHGIVTLHRIDDTSPVQSAQIEGYSSEMRDGMQRHQMFGMSTVPLPGSKGYATYQSGHRGAATVLSVEDPRYRPKTSSRARSWFIWSTGLINRAPAGQCGRC
jgi:phage gp45-like